MQNMSIISRRSRLGGEHFTFLHGITSCVSARSYDELGVRENQQDRVRLKGVSYPFFERCFALHRADHLFSPSKLSQFRYACLTP